MGALAQGVVIKRGENCPISCRTKVGALNGLQELACSSSAMALRVNNTIEVNSSVGRGGSEN